MKNSFSIGELSELLNIPKSTLRYWESEGLIQRHRDDENNYRKYTPNSVYTISDLAHYRCLRMSIEDMKKLPLLEPHELAASLSDLDRNLDEKLMELYTAKAYITKKMEYINEYKRLCEHPYQREMPDYDSIYQFSIEDHQAWAIYIKDQYQSILLYNEERGFVETGLAIPTSDNHPKLWEKDDNADYLSFVLKVPYSDPSVNDFHPHLEKLSRQGYQVTNLFARYLFSACDGQYYDYYKAFAEVRGGSTCHRTSL
jgi:DNA-binding transcriptional MerR regulator